VKGPATEVIESIGVKISFQNKYKTVQFPKKTKKVLAFYESLCYDMRAIEDCSGYYALLA